MKAIINHMERLQIPREMRRGRGDIMEQGWPPQQWLSHDSVGKGTRGYVRSPHCVSSFRCRGTRKDRDSEFPDRSCPSLDREAGGREGGRERGREAV